MTVLEEILGSLKSCSKVQKIRSEGEFRAASSIIDGVGIDGVERMIERVLSRYSQRGEEIITKIKDGVVLDGGDASFKITGGFVIEFYDYEDTASLFIRNYRISDGDREWVAVYIDENPYTPWWCEERD